MKKQRFTETQIVSILKQYDGGPEPMEGSDYILISENEEEERQKRIAISDVKEVWKVRRRITAQLPPSKRFKITV